MTGLIVSVVCFAYLVVSFAFARRAYSREYDKIYGAPAPSYYGGKIGHERAHELAIREGVEWLGLWPLYCTWALIYRLISGPVPLHVKLDEAQAEVDRLAMKQDPLNDLDHTVGAKTVTHSVPEQGYEFVRAEDPWLWDDRVEITTTPHPERIIQVQPGKIWTGARWVKATTKNEKIYGPALPDLAVDPLPHSPVLAPGDCVCPKCRPDLYMWRQA